MCDSEDDLSSMSTVPYEYDASDDSIYEKETQAIDGELDNVVENRGSYKDNRCNSAAEIVLYDGPTQPLKFIDSGLRCNSSTVGQSTSSETKQIADSDCETIPESPMFNKDPLGDQVDLKKIKPRQASSVSSFTDDDDRTQRLPLVHRVNTFNITNRQDCISPEIPLYEGPTQQLLIKSHITPNSSQEDIACTSTAGQSIDISDFDALPMSPHYYQSEDSSRIDRKGSAKRESTRSETPIYDGPTQPLPVRNHTKPTEYTRSETPIYDGPTQPLPVRSLTKTNSVSKEICASSTGEKKEIYEIFTFKTNVSIHFTESNLHVPSPVRRTSASSDMDIEDDDNDQTQVIPELIHSFERGPSSVATVIPDAENDEISDCETLPSSPVHHLNSTLEIPSTQSAEDKRPLQRSDVWGALKKVDNWDSETADSCPLSPDLFTVASPCPELDAVQNTTTESEKNKNDDQDPNDSRRDPTIEMDRATIPASPVFDFDDSHSEQGNEETQVLSPLPYQGSPAFVAETPFVPMASGGVSEEIPVIAETPFVVDFESPLVSDETPRKKRKIVRRSGHACRQLLPEDNLSIGHRASTPQDMELESTKEEERFIDDAVSVESDFELTFASHYSALPTLTASASSTEPPFVGFEAMEVEEPTIHLEQIRQIIDEDQMESMEEGNASEKVSAQLSPAPVETTAIAGPSTANLPAPRRSSRKPVPNTRRTLDISETNQEPVVIKRRPGRPPKAAIKIEVQASNESDASEPVGAVRRRPGPQGKGFKIEVESSDENVSEPVVAAIKRRPGRPPKIQAGSSLPNDPSTTKKSVTRKVSVSMILSDATESGEDNRAANQRTSRKTRCGRKGSDAASVSVVEPPTTQQSVKNKSRNQMKKEPTDDSLLENTLNKTKVAAHRQSKRGVNNNTDDVSVTSSVGSSSPSKQEATRRPKRPLAGQVKKE